MAKIKDKEAISDDVENKDGKLHNVGYLFGLFKDANRNGDDIVITKFSKKSISLRIEFQKEGIFRFEDKSEKSAK